MKARVAMEEAGGIVNPMASNLSSEEILCALEKMDAAELEQLAPRVIALTGENQRFPRWTDYHDAKPSQAELFK